MYRKEDKYPNIIFVILSFLFCILGIIFYIIYKDSLPIRARLCLVWTVIGVVFFTIFYTLLPLFIITYFE